MASSAAPHRPRALGRGDRADAGNASLRSDPIAPAEVRTPPSSLGWRTKRAVRARRPVNVVSAETRSSPDVVPLRRGVDRCLGVKLRGDHCLAPRELLDGEEWSARSAGETAADSSTPITARASSLGAVAAARLRSRPNQPRSQQSASGRFGSTRRLTLAGADRRRRMSPPTRTRANAQEARREGPASATERECQIAEGEAAQSPASWLGSRGSVEHSQELQSVAPRIVGEEAADPRKLFVPAHRHPRVRQPLGDGL